MSEDYILDIVSLDKNIEGKPLKKYAIENTDFIGVYENEPFEIVFKNNTHKKVQVIISVDGTDVLSGKLASTEPNARMLLVNSYGSLKLQAWPETNSGGARFVFTNTDNSVASNTHGNLSSKGIIAVAVFEEGYVPSYNIWGNHPHPSAVGSGQLYGSGGLYSNNLDKSFSNYSYNTDQKINLDSGQYSSNQINLISESDSRASNPKYNKIEQSASVGAGEYVQQTLTTVAGLTQPKLATTIRVKYEWWSSLRSKLRKIGVEQTGLQSTNGFPGDKKNIDLAKTPRIKSSARQEYCGRVRHSRRRNRNYAEFQRFV
jgi:hypothetical protein